MAEIEQLRELLFKREQQRLDKLEKELHDREQRIDALGEILPESLNRLQDDKRLQQSLNPQFIRGIETTIRNNPKRFAVMFYPVIGPAIRRAIGEALKGLLENINHTMEHSVSARSWGWRLESWRSGVPFNQIVLKHTLAYSIDEVFLVQNDSGLLLARSARDDAEVLDRDAVAAMLTAIQRFMHESFATDDDSPVRSIEIGEHTLWIVPGRDASLVALIQGAISRDARGELQQQLEKMHDGHEVLLRDYQQHVALPDKLTDELEDDLSACLLRKQLDVDVDKDNEAKKPPIMLWLLSLVILAIAAWQLWQWWWLDIDRDQLVERIEQTPGWVLMDDSVSNDRVQIRALYDPLAATPESLTATLSIDQTRVRFLLEDYQSADAGLALQRLANATSVDRTRLQLNANKPANSLQTFSVEGALPRTTWQSLLRLSAAFGLQVNKPPQMDIASLNLTLAVPDGVEMQWRGDVLEVSGEVNAVWREGLAGRLMDLGIAAKVDDLSAGLLERRTSLLKQRWNGHLLRFDDAELTAESVTELASFIQEAQALTRLIGNNRLPFAIQLSGLTDGRFSAPVNVELRQQRTNMVRDQLIEAGFRVDALRVVEVTDGSGENDVRAVRIQLPRLAADD